MYEIKIYNRNLIARDKYGNVFLMDATGKFKTISTFDLYMIIKDERYSH